MIIIKLSSPKGQEKVTFCNDIHFHSFIETISKNTEISIDKLQSFTGYPLQQIFGEHHHPLASIKLLVTGSVVVVKDGFPPSLTSSDNNDVMKFSRYVIDADNSCLFNALGYLINREPHIMGDVYRLVIADAIRSDTGKYSAEILGKSPEDYIEWIKNPDKWGGEIEMVILSTYLNVEIAAVDVQTGNVYVYGEDSKFTNRVYLLYDGIHYDAIIATNNKTIDNSKELGDNDSTGNNTGNDIVSIFEVNDKIAALEASQIALELRNKKHFMDFAGCDLQCLICLYGLKGQKEAEEHGKLTGHQNFGQIAI